MLRELKAFYDANSGLCLPPGFMSQRVSYKARLTANGMLLDLLALTTETSKKSIAGQVLAIPNLVRQGCKPKFTCDSAVYLFPSLGKTNYCQAFLELHCRAAEQIPELECIVLFLKNDPDQYLEQYPQVVSKNVIALCDRDGDPFFNLPSVKQFWANEIAEEGSAGYCSISGEPAPLRVNNLYQIKNVPEKDGKTSGGVSLLSAYADSFKFHGIGGGGVEYCSIGQSSYEATHQALNYLTLEDKHSKRIGTWEWVWWSDSPQADFTWDVLTQPDEDAPRQWLELLYKPGAKPTPGGKFYFTGLQAGMGRLRVTPFYEERFAAVCQNITLWLERQTIGSKRYGLYPLIACTYSPGQDELLEKDILAYLESALLGRSLPSAVLKRLIARTSHMEPTVVQLCVMKLYLLLKGGMTDLKDLTSEEQLAFQLGKVYAVLRAIANNPYKLDEQGGTYTDRLYSFFVANPQLGFDRCMSAAERYQLREDKRATYHRQKLDEAIAQLHAPIPKSFTPEQKAAFHLGVSYGRTEIYAKKEDTKNG